MNIQDYYREYNSNKKCDFDLNLEPKTSVTIKDFYNDCIKQTLLKKSDVIAWHKMFMEYVDLPDAIYWVRYHESGPRDEITNRYKNRRGCLTRFKDGFSYVYVSNYDAHEIFNMISKGVVPTASEFLSLMKSYSFPMHYDKGKSCEESDLVAYPNVGNVRSGVLTANNWYLAHINGIKTEYKMFDGKSRKLNRTEINHLFPRGEKSDWHSVVGKPNCSVRELDYSLESYEKEIIKAHFLRFVDPLNYFLSPGTKHEIDSVTSKGTNIAEFKELTRFIREEYKKEYGTSEMIAFSMKALLPNSSLNKVANSQRIINITYGKQVINDSSIKSSSSVKTKSGTKKTLGNDEFESYSEYLVKKGLKPSTCSNYKNALRNVMRDKNVADIESLNKDIDCLISLYDGNDKKSHNRHISALKKYKNFLLNQ